MARNHTAGMAMLGLRQSSIEAPRIHHECTATLRCRGLAVQHQPVSMPFRPLIPLWLLGRTLLRHLLLILLYAGLGANAFEAIGIIG